VELTEDLVETSVPGDEVTVTGVVKVRGFSEFLQNVFTGKNKSLFS